MLLGDSIIRNSIITPFKFTPLQLNAIAERLRLGDPTFCKYNKELKLVFTIYINL